MSLMRELSVTEITKNIREMCIEANYYIESDVKAAIQAARLSENSDVGRSVLEQLDINMEIAENERIPVCQDTGITVVFLDVGQDVHFTDGDITEAVNEGVRQGYEEGYLRKSVVDDPILRKNTGDNTPAIIHFNIVPGDKVGITVAPKGFGSENTSRIFMLKPADGIEGVKAAVVETARAAGPNACPPFVVGVGIGGDFEKCAIMAKRALTRSISDPDAAAGHKDTSLQGTVSGVYGGYSAGSDELKDKPLNLCEGHGRKEYVRDLEKELLQLVNETGLGPAGLGGSVTALAVNVETFPTHIAGLPVAVCMCCHVNRHKYREL